MTLRTSGSEPESWFYHFLSLSLNFLICQMVMKTAFT